MKLRFISLLTLVIALSTSVILLPKSTLPKQTSAASTDPLPLPTIGYTLDKILGQPNFQETMINKIVPSRAFHIGGVHVDSKDRIYAVDSGNNRILGFKTYTGDNKNADIVIGQPQMTEKGTSNGNNTSYNNPTASTLAIQPYPETMSTLESPRSLTLATDAAGNLYVPDLNNNRVLKFNDPFNTDSKADAVWGQPNFTSRLSYCGQPGRTPTASTLCTEWDTVASGSLEQVFASGVDVDSNENLWVADTGNHRVLRFPKDSNVANLVLGQADFTQRLRRTVFDFSLNKLSHPIAVRVKRETGEIYVLEGEVAGDNRILVFSPNSTNGATAVREIGRAYSQIDEPKDTTNWENYEGRWVHVTTGLYWSRGFVFDRSGAGDIWVNDGHNQRVVLFNSLGIMDPNNLIGEPNLDTRNCDGQFGQGYEQKDGSKNSLCDNDGEIGIDSQNNLYIAKLYYPTDIARFPLPLQRNPNNQNLVKSNGWLLHEARGGWNEYSGSTFQNTYGISLSKNSTPPQLSVSDGQRILTWNNYQSVSTYQPASFVTGQDQLNANFNDEGIFAGQNIDSQTVGGNHLWASAGDRIYAFSLPIGSSGKFPTPKKVLFTGQYTQGNVYWADENTKVKFNANGLLYDENTSSLWVSDSANNRVLHIKTPLTDAKVDLVLGQPDKKTIGNNAGGTTPNAQGFGNPWTLNYDNFGNLYVVDSIFEGWANGTNNRVLRFDAAKTTPIPDNIFPFPSASGVYAKKGFDANPGAPTLHRPNNPTWVTFDSNNRMFMTVDSYGNTQFERIFVYPPDHASQVIPQPQSVIPIPVGQAAHIFVTPDDNHAILQDHTWNRILFATLSLPKSTPSLSTPTPPPIPTSAPQTNLLPNPSFELDTNNNTYPDSWSTNSHFTRSSSSVKSGSFSGRHFSSINTNYFVLSPVISNITAGKTYNFSHWINIPPTTDTFQMRFIIRWKNNAGTTISEVTMKNYSAQTSGWTNHSYNVIAPASAVRAIIVMNLQSLKGPIYVDNFRLSKIN